MIGDADEIWIGFEAAIGQGWWETFELDAFLGMESFGASAPAKILYGVYGLTADNLAEAALDMLEDI